MQNAYPRSARTSRTRLDDDSSSQYTSKTTKSSSTGSSKTTPKMVRVVLKSKAPVSLKEPTSPTPDDSRPLNIPYRMSSKNMAAIENHRRVQREAHIEGQKQRLSSVRQHLICSPSFLHNFPAICDLTDALRNAWDEGDARDTLIKLHGAFLSAFRVLWAFAQVEGVQTDAELMEAQMDTFARVSRYGTQLQRLKDQRVTDQDPFTSFNLDDGDIGRLNARVESLLEQFDALNALTVSKVLESKPLPPIPAESDEDDEDSVYYDAESLDESVRNSISIVPPSPGHHNRTDSSDTTPSAPSSSGSSHTKVNSISSTLSASTAADPPTKPARKHLLPLEIAFAPLLSHQAEDETDSPGGYDDPFDSPRRPWGDYMKYKRNKSKLSFTSHEKSPTMDSVLGLTDTFSLAESDSHSALTGGLHRLRHIATTNSSKASLLSPRKSHTRKPSLDGRETPFSTSDHGLTQVRSAPSSPRKRHSAKAYRRFIANPLLDPTLQVLVNHRASMADAICFDTQGKVTGSTMTGIATVLSSRDGFTNLALVHSVFASFRSSSSSSLVGSSQGDKGGGEGGVTSVDLVLELQNLFIKGPVHLAGSREDHDAETQIYRGRIAKLVVFWFHYHWDDVHDYSSFSTFSEFVDFIVQTDCIAADVKQQLQDAVDAIKQGLSPRVPMVPSFRAPITPPSRTCSPSPAPMNNIPAPRPESEETTLLTLKSYNSSKGRLAFATQLTLITADLFGRIEPGLLVEYWSLTADERDSVFEQQRCRDGQATTQVLAYRDFEEALTMWVTSTVLCPEDVPGRVDKIEFWLDVAVICMDELRNYSGASCIYAGVGYSAVKQLKQTILNVPAPTKAKYHKLEAFFDQHGNFRVAREALASCASSSTPFIPFSALFKKDLHGFRGRAEELKRSRAEGQGPLSTSPVASIRLLPSLEKRVVVDKVLEAIPVQVQSDKHIDVSDAMGKGSAMATLISRQPYELESDNAFQAWIAKRLIAWADNSQRISYANKLNATRKKREPRITRPILEANGHPVMTETGEPAMLELNPYPEYQEGWDWVPGKDGRFVHIGNKEDLVAKAAPTSIKAMSIILHSVTTKTKTFASGLRSERQI